MLPITSSTSSWPAPAGFLGRVAPGLSALLLALVVAAIAAPPEARAAPPPPGFFGTQSWDPLTGADLSRLSRANVRVYRTLVLWRKVEPRKPVGDCATKCRHTYDWRLYDERFRLAARRGVRILPTLHGSPGWAASKPQWQPVGRSAKAAFRDFARAAAARYGPHGALWSKAPWSTSAPAPAAVRSPYWQVWNEPNISNYWRGGPDASEYAGMLKGVSRALKRASAGVRVVAAGLPWPAVGIRADNYLWTLLGVRGVREATDVVAIHPYARDVVARYYGQEGVMDHVRQARDVMVSRGAGTKKMWITEIGWASGAPDGRFTVSEQQQARNLDDLYRRLLSVRGKYNLLGAAWFSFRDTRAEPGQADYWGYRSGLVRRDGTAKPSWKTFRARALSGY